MPGPPPHGEVGVGGGRAPTRQPREHFSCSQDFSRSLYELLIFTFYSRSLMLCKCEGAESKQLSKVSRMFRKVHCFCLQRAGPGALAASPPAQPFLLIINQLVCNETYFGDHGKEFLKEATDRTQ